MFLNRDTESNSIAIVTEVLDSDGCEEFVGRRNARLTGSQASAVTKTKSRMLAKAPRNYVKPVKVTIEPTQG